MNQQGGRPTGHEDDWWRQLYDDSTEDTGPAAAADSLDDRFASAAGTVGSGGTTGPAGPADPAGGAPGSASAEGPGSAPTEEPDSVPTEGPGSAPAPSDARPAESRRAPWEPPPVPPPGSAAFPSGPLPTGFDERSRRAEEPPSAAPAAPAPARTPPTPAVPASRTPPDGRPPQPPEAPTAAATGTGLPFPRPAASPSAPPSAERPAVKPYVGSGPPTYDAEPTALPPADPDELEDLVADTALDGARYGACTLRAASVRGDSARYRGEPRRDSLLTARFGTGEQALILVAMATGARATPRAHRAAAEVCRWIGRAVGRSHVRLAQDIRAARRGDLKSGLHRLTDRSLGRLRAGAAEQGLAPDEYAATLRCLLLPADPECRTRVFFGVGPGGLFRLRDGVWQDIEPRAGEVTGEPVVGFGSPPAETPGGDRLTMDLGIPTPPDPYDPAPEPPREPFRFRASVARPGDTLLMCTTGLAEPLRGEPHLPAHLTERWSQPVPPGLAAFLADIQVRVKGYADDRTAAAVWEA